MVTSFDDHVMRRPASAPPILSRAAADSCTACPTRIRAGGASIATLATGTGSTEIEAVPLFPSLVPVMLTTPAVRAVASPVPDTVARVRSLELQVTSREAKDARERLETVSWELDNLSRQDQAGDAHRQGLTDKMGEVQIQRERKAYYDILERAQKQSLDVTEWLAWFLETLHRAVDQAQHTLDAVLAKTRFWQRWAAPGSAPLNERQVKLLHRLLDGFEGKLTSSKWAAIAKCSPDTALRDITEMLARGVLRKSDAGGRSTSYELNDSADPAGR
jgi:hypothetical protein